MFASLKLLTVVTPRLILRPMRLEDAKIVIEWRNAEHVLSKSATPSIHFNEDEHLKWFRSSRESRLDYIVESKKDQVPIGSVSFQSHKMGQHKVAESGKYIGEKRYLSKGLGFEMTTHWLGFGFDTAGLDLVVARVIKSNKKNIKINFAHGFREASPSQRNQFEGNLSKNLLLLVLSKQDFATTRKRLDDEGTTFDAR